MVAIPLQRLEGKYEILEKLQEGGMGAIYKVRHRLLGEIRVVKVIRPHLEQDSSLKSRFLKEARAAARLSHPNIAQIYDYTVDEDGLAYIVMEFIRGMTVGEMLRAGELPPVALTLEIARQSLRAIGHIHNHGIVHRDIAPDNLMLTRDVDGRPLVKLIDLGLAKTIEGSGSQLTGAGVFVGKFRYAAPEQFDESNDHNDQRLGDLYSFGVVLYELLTGRYPIAGSSPSSLIAGHLFRPPLDFDTADPGGRVPEEIRRAVLRSLAKAPRERFEDAESFADALADESDDLADPETTRLLALTQSGLRLPVVGPPPGSTQVRLDRQFAPEPTPPPERKALPDDETVASEELDEMPTVALPAAAPALRLAPPVGDDPPGIEAAAERIEALIEDGGFDAARSELERFEAALGKYPTLAELAARLEEIEGIANRSAVQGLLHKAQLEAAADRYDAALDALRKALAIAPRDEQVQSLLGATERAARNHREKRERERSVAESAARVESLLAAGDLVEASRALQTSGERLGGHPRFSRLRHEIVERLQAAPESSPAASGDAPEHDGSDAGGAGDAAELLRRAREHHRAGRLAEAIDDARRARGLAPEQRMIQVLLFELESEQRARADDQAQAAAQQAAEQKIRDRVEAEGLGAGELLPEALDAAGPTLMLRHLQAQVAREADDRRAEHEHHDAERRQRADALVAEARSQAQTEDFAAARDLLRRALEHAPDHPEALALMASVEACLRVQEEEQRETEEMERTIIGIRGLLEQGRSKAALDSLSAAESRFGDHKGLQDLHYEAARAQLETSDLTAAGAAARTEEAPAPDLLVTRAIENLPAPKAPAAARPVDDATRTLHLDGGVAGSGAPRNGPASSLAEAMTAIRDLQAAGKTGEALEVLQVALQTHGPLQELQNLRYELSQALLERNVEEEEISGSQAIPTLGVAATGPPTAETVAPASEKPTVVMTSPLGNAAPATSSPQPAAPARFDEIALDSMLEAPVTATAQPQPGRKPSVNPRRSGPPGGQSSRMMLIAGLMVVIVFAFLGILLSHLSSRPSAPEVGLATEDVQPIDLQPGTVVIDAAPWAEITRIAPLAAGSEPGEAGSVGEEVAITPSRFTPVILELPPGRYLIRWRYPPGGQEEEEEVEVVSSERLELRPVFEQLDGKRYFEQVGW